MQSGLHPSIHAFKPDEWDALNPSRYPGLLHGFLSSLEDSKSVGEGTGWEPIYASVKRGSDLLGAMVCYLKSDSYGEYVFDWAWADAYHRNGINYYPKCVTAIPFTPATGPRVLLKDGEDYVKITGQLIEVLKNEFADRVSSWHILFLTSEAHNSCALTDHGSNDSVYSFIGLMMDLKPLMSILRRLIQNAEKRCEENEDVFLIRGFCSSD